MDKSEKKTVTKERIEITGHEALKLLTEGRVTDEETEIAMKETEHVQFVQMLQDINE